MNRKFWIGSLVAFVVWMAGSFLIHGTLLKNAYLALPALFRPEAEAQEHLWIMILAHVMLAIAFVWIYSRGISSAPWMGQGLRFGIAVAFLAVIPTYLIYYVVQPMPAGLAHKQMIFDGLLVVVLGLTVAAVYRNPPAGKQL